MGGGGEPWKGDVISGGGIDDINGSGGGGGSGNGGEGPTGHWGKLEGQERLGDSHQTYSKRKNIK